MWLRALSLGNKWVINWGAGHRQGTGEAGKGEVGEQAETPSNHVCLFCGFRGPVSLLALSSGSRLGRGQQSVMGQDRWPCHVTLVC